MDLHEHGISAYPEYVISALAAPQGMPRDTVGYYAVRDRMKANWRVEEVIRPPCDLIGTHLIGGSDCYAPAHRS